MNSFLQYIYKYQSGFLPCHWIVLPSLIPTGELHVSGDSVTVVNPWTNKADKTCICIFLFNVVNIVDRLNHHFSNDLSTRQKEFTQTCKRQQQRSIMRWKRAITLNPCSKIRLTWLRKNCLNLTIRNCDVCTFTPLYVFRFLNAWTQL